MGRKRIYGTGNKHLVGKIWYVRYYDAAGIRRHESAGTEDEAKAERFLNKRKAQVLAGQNVEPKKNVGAIAKAYFSHLEAKSWRCGSRSSRADPGVASQDKAEKLPPAVATVGTPPHGPFRRSAQGSVNPPGRIHYRTS